MGRLASGLGLLRLPRMPDLRKPLGAEEFVPSPVDPATVPYKDKAREKQRQKVREAGDTRRREEPGKLGNAGCFVLARMTVWVRVWGARHKDQHGSERGSVTSGGKGEGRHGCTWFGWQAGWDVGQQVPYCPYRDKAVEQQQWKTQVAVRVGARGERARDAAGR